jgi:hypothetical protein
VSATGYLIWFIVTTVVVVGVMGIAIAGASGLFDAKERAARATAREERRRLEELRREERRQVEQRRHDDGGSVR